MDLKCALLVAIYFLMHFGIVHLAEINATCVDCELVCNIMFTGELKDGDSLKLYDLNGDNVVSCTSITIGFSRTGDIPSGIFETFYDLENLHIYHGNFSVLQNSFKEAKKLRHLNLEWGGIKTIKDNAFDGTMELSELNLSNNLIQAIGRRTFAGATNIKLLTLDNNQIETIEENAFDGMKPLSELNLGFNLIRVVGRLTFAGAPFIKLLILDYNKIETIEEGAFDGMIELSELNLNGNLLCTVDRWTFRGAPNIKLLSLYGNKIETIEDNAFDAMIKLSELNLAKNLIRTVGHWTFTGAPNIEILDLSLNRIEMIEDVFDLPKLKTLRLSHNKLKLLYDTVPQGVPNLENLCLNDNKLIYIKNIFIGFTHLRHLSLSKNSLKDVNLTSFSTLESLRSLELHNTSFTFPQYIPENARSSSKLKTINLSANNLSNPDILKHLSMFGQLENLYIFQNRFNVFNDIEKISDFFPQIKFIELAWNEPSLCEWIKNEEALRNIDVTTTVSRNNWETCSNHIRGQQKIKREYPDFYCQ